jgi:ATP-dependent RNA helicase DeaD
MDNKKFEHYGFSKEMVKALINLGYEKLTVVQEQVIPLVLKDKDIIVKAETGSGKTAAFAIPISEKIELEQRNPQALILTPTRELAVQLKQDISNIGRYKRIRCAALFGRQPMEIQRRELRQRVHVIVGTPGRTLDHMERQSINLVEIKYLILDEADKMLDMGFLEQVEAIIKLLPRKRVTMLFSATMPERIGEICRQYMIHPVEIEVDSESPATDKIQQIYYEIEENRKVTLVTKIIYVFRPESCILFCSTREKVDILFEHMKRAGFLCGCLHGGMEQKDRLHAIESFKRGKFHFLIATDVVARGIHIDEVSLVINVDMPLDSESYVHRIGRTGRAGNMGKAIAFVTPNERKLLSEIEEYVHYKIPKEEIPVDEEVEKGKKIFEINSKDKPILKIDKSEELNREIIRIRINGGKKAKMRPGDILGAITSIIGISAVDIGIIDVQDTCSYVEILGDKGDLVMDALQETKIKGKLYTIKKVGFRSI